MVATFRQPFDMLRKPRTLPPDLRRTSGQFGEKSDLADETVSREPVSGFQIPASRENAGNFCEFVPDQANGVWLKCWYCVVFLQNSLHNPAGNFRAEFDPSREFEPCRRR